MIAPYRIKKGKIQNQYCEINVAEQCNLACRSCSHLAPMMARAFVDPSDVFRDLHALATVYHVDRVKLLGGEPLLHPGILDVISAVTASGVADGVCVVTNGTLLPRMTAAFWSAVEEVWVSSYPGFELSSSDLHSCQEGARQHGARLQVVPYPFFREAHSTLGTTDEVVAARIYATCHVAHDWRCHTIASGYFYRCPQSYFIPRALGAAPGMTEQSDGIPIVASPTFMTDLLAYLTEGTPPASCYRCLGTVGQRFPHQQLDRSTWTLAQSRPTIELLDWSILQQEEQRAAADVS